MSNRKVGGVTCRVVSVSFKDNETTLWIGPDGRVHKQAYQGKNPFTEFQLPEAILKFKQGFGRLIRTMTDRGIVVILDPRVRTKPYGPSFLRALPRCRIVDDDPLFCRGKPAAG